MICNSLCPIDDYENGDDIRISTLSCNILAYHKYSTNDPHCHNYYMFKYCMQQL